MSVDETVQGDTEEPGGSSTTLPPAHRQPRHPVTGRFLAFDCEVDCLEHCAGLCGEWTEGDRP